MGIEVRYGQELDESAFMGLAPRGEPRQLAPGETDNMRWSEADYAEMTKFLATKHPVSSYRKLHLDLYEVRFVDGTVWSHGKLFRIDPRDPRKRTPLDEAAKERNEPVLNRAANERLIEVPPYKSASEQDVLVISEIKVAGQAVTPGQPFMADANWLRSLTVRVKKISTKPIVFLHISFGLPEAQYHAGGVGFDLRYGRDASSGGQTAPDAKVLLPGEEAELSFNEANHEATRRFAEKMCGITEFSRVRVGNAAIVFADGSRAFILNPVRTQKPSAPVGTK